MPSTTFALTTPRLPAPVLGLARHLMVRELQRRWHGSRLDLHLPEGQRVRLGERGRADATVWVADDRMFERLLLRGELGAGESFVAGEWHADDLVVALRAFLRATAARGVESPLTWLGRLASLLRHRAAANTPSGSQRNVQAHYDLGNELYRVFLDEETMAYSSALWPRSGMSLAEAQVAKLERVCELLQLSPRDHLLEIGCGWGGLAIHAARTRGCRVTALTVSREQEALARTRVRAAGVAELVTIAYRDYRDIIGQHDRVASIEMVEAVGAEFQPRFFAACARALRPGGRMVLQAITMPDERLATYRRNVDWMQTYVFPGSSIPSLASLRADAAAVGLRTVEATDIGPDYAPTLRAWHERFSAGLHRVRALGFDDRFIRTWQLYLAFSEAAFAERTLGVHQLVLVPR